MHCLLSEVQNPDYVLPLHSDSENRFYEVTNIAKTMATSMHYYSIHNPYILSKLIVNRTKGFLSDLSERSSL